MPKAPRRTTLFSTDRLRGQPFQWDRKTAQLLNKISQPVPEGILIDGHDPQMASKIQDALFNHAVTLIADTPLLHNSFEEAVFSVSSNTDHGKFVDAEARGKCYAAGKPFQPMERTVAQALTSKAKTWQLNLETQDTSGHFSIIQDLWQPSCGRVSEIKITSPQYWTNVCLGLGGYFERPVPYITAYRILHGSQDLFFSSTYCTTSATYRHLCKMMANYEYRSIPDWKHVKLHPGHILVVPPHTCIAALTTETHSKGTVAASYSFMPSEHLDLLELSARMAYDISLDPQDYRPALIKWMMPHGPADTLGPARKEILWRLLAFDDKGDPSSYVVNTRPDLNKFLIIAPPPPVTFFALPERLEQVEGGYEIDAQLDPDVSERLQQLVPKSSRISNFWARTVPYPALKAWRNRCASL